MRRMLVNVEKRGLFGALIMSKSTNSSGPPKLPGGQGTGHLKSSSIKSFSQPPVTKANKSTGKRSGH